MAEGTIGLPVDGTGTKLRTVTGTANMPASVHAEVMALQGVDGTEVQAKDGGLLIEEVVKNAKSVTATTIAATTIYTPAAGNSVRCFLVGLYAPATNGNTVVTFTLGTNTYTVPMGGPDKWQHKVCLEGPVNGSITVTMTVAQTIYVVVDVVDF